MFGYSSYNQLQSQQSQNSTKLFCRALLLPSDICWLYLSNKGDALIHWMTLFLRQRSKELTISNLFLGQKGPVGVTIAGHRYRQPLEEPRSTKLPQLNCVANLKHPQLLLNTLLSVMFNLGRAIKCLDVK